VQLTPAAPARNIYSVERSGDQVLNAGYAGIKLLMPQTVGCIDVIERIEFSADTCMNFFLHLPAGHCAGFLAKAVIRITKQPLAAELAIPRGNPPQIQPVYAVFGFFEGFFTPATLEA
jgi:hypothetical protein